MAKSNRRGRAQDEASSVYAKLGAKLVNMTVDGEARRVSPQDAYEHQIYQEAMNDDIGAVRIVLGWIDERELARKQKSGRPQAPCRILMETLNPVQMDEAALILGIAHELPDRGYRDDRYLELANWAVSWTLKRRRKWKLTDSQIVELRKHVENPDAIAWPKGWQDNG